MTVSTSAIRVALLDDHAVVRSGIAAYLSGEKDMHLVGTYGTGREMLRGLQTQPADVLLVDYSLGPAELDGISLIRALVTRFPTSRIVVLSAHYEPATVALALRAGVKGFVGKHEDLSRVVHAIRVVNAGRTFVDDQMAYRLAESATDPETQPADGDNDAVQVIMAGSTLSTKEREVLRCFLDGLTIAQIAEKFGRSPKTISSQKSVAYRKLGVSSDIELFKMKHMLETL